MVDKRTQAVNFADVAEAPSGGVSRVAPAFAGVSAEQIIFALFVVGIAVAPFWFASNVIEAWGANALFYGLLLSAYEISLAVRGRPHPVGVRLILPAAVGFAAVILWIAIQWVGWTPQSWHHPLWEMATEALGEDLRGSITVDPEHTLIAGLRALTAAAVFWLALQLCRDRRRASQFLTAIALIGIAYATYGLVAFLLFPDTILWYPKFYYKESLTSTFINRNSYATYAGLTLLACLGVVVTVYRRAVERAGGVRRYQLGALIQATAGWGGFLLLGFFIIAGALVLTGSRAGITFSLTGLLVLCGLLIVGGRKHGRFVGAIVVAVIVAIVASLITYGELFAQRLANVQAADRWAVYKVTWESIIDAPLLGMGYGTFEDIFPMYRDATIGSWGIWDKAHNTYLEVLQGLGLPVGLVFIASVLFLVVLCFRGALTRQRDAIAPAVAASASVIVGLHSFVDFSLQMQAVALTWMALLGLGVAQTWSSRTTTKDG
jgi:O-antigen ligase